MSGGKAYPFAGGVFFGPPIGRHGTGGRRPCPRCGSTSREWRPLGAEVTSSASVGVTLSGRWRGEEAQRLPPLEGVYLQPPGLNPGCGFAFWPGWHVGSALPAGAKLTARAMPASSAMTSLRVLLIFTLWGAKIRCPPKKSVICRQDANFGTTHALTSATQKASPPAGQAVSSSTTMRKRSLIPPCPQAVAASDGITRIRESRMRSSSLASVKPARRVALVTTR